jgi:hypothetical protein
MGMIFKIEDGTEAHVALPITLFQAFGAEYVLAMNTAAELCEMAYSKPRGST